MKPIIKAQGISKQYRLGAKGAAYTTLRESLTGWVRTPIERLRKTTRPTKETLWALKDIGFEVNRGEVVGIIGRNGAGKSTLLKVLSRITEPTTGSVALWGRISSLLEVGTGFHPELTGRENIYLNGAILGMKRAEIQQKFDEIVSFAEIEKFVDTPVKHYSSGMYLRLAFSVAAHLEPDVLIVDEVLSVGDNNFQRKCLGKMEQLGEYGRTVLFVSHNMPAVLRLCNRAILIDKGRLVDDGAPAQVTKLYLHSNTGSPAERIWDSLDSAPGDQVARLHAVQVVDERGKKIESVEIRQPFRVEVQYWNLQKKLRPTVLLQFFNEDGICLFQTNDFNNGNWWQSDREPGLISCICELPGNFFSEGRLYLTVGIGTYNPNALHTLERDAIAFDIFDQSEGDGVRGEYVGGWPGVLRPMFKWKVVPLAEAKSESTGDVIE
jgi:lipopolysaccharide transport system ATP-binding protein